MSLASKITFGVTCLLSVATITGVMVYQESERNAIRQGPIKDAARVKQKREAAASEPEHPSLTPQQLQRQAEYEMQKKLQQEYQAVQVVDESQRISGKDVPHPAGK